MYGRFYNIAVITLWLLTTGWLVTQKFLPPLLVGEPPSYRTILRAKRSEPLVGWKMDFNGQPLGWALSSTKELPNRLTKIHSLVHFDRLPLEQMTPEWLRTPLQLWQPPHGNLQMDAQSTLVLDPLGRLSRFESSIRIDPLDATLQLQGVVEGGELELGVRSGELSYNTRAHLSSDALLGDALSLQTHLLGLRTGQKWTVPAYSLFRPPNDPLEILQATVERTKSIRYNGRLETVHLVVYRNDAGFALDTEDAVRGRLWVRRDGTVLIQEVMLLNSKMTFVRLTNEELAEPRHRKKAERILAPITR